MTPRHDQSEISFLRHYAIVFLAALSGTLISFLVFFAFEQHVKRESTRNFEWSVTERFNTLRHHILTTVKEMDEIARFFTSSQQVDPHEFLTFAQPMILEKTSLQTVAWAPQVARQDRKTFEEKTRQTQPDFQITEHSDSDHLVTAGQRSVYYPIHYRVSTTEKTDQKTAQKTEGLGFDLGSHPAFLPAMEQARQSGESTASGRIRLGTITHPAFGMIYFLPVYRTDGTTQGTTQDKAFLGFAVGWYRIDILVEQAIQRLSPRGIDFWIHDRSAEEASQLLYFHRSRLSHAYSHDRSPPTQPTGDDEILFHSSFKVGKRSWSMTARPNPLFHITQNPIPPWIILVGGLMVTALISLYLVRLQLTLRERRRSEKIIKILNRNNDLILNAAGEGIYGIDLEGKTTFINPSGAMMVGWEREDMIGKSQHHVLHHSRPDGSPYPLEECPVHDTLRSGRTHFINNEVFWRRDGTALPVEYTSTSIIDGHIITGAVVIFRDISDQIKIQEEKRIKESAIAANQAKSAFLATMSHDIRTPMNAILGMGEMLAESPLNEDQQHYVQVINNAGEGLLALINDVLDLSKIEAGQLDLESIPFDPRQLADNTIKIFKSKADSQRIGLVLDFDRTVPPLVEGDPQRLKQILLNLLSNAIKFTPQGKVTLSVKRCSNVTIRFSVADTGIGLSQEQRQRVFEPFTQADSSTTRRFGGTGLGLSICQKLVNRMEGRIYVTSQQERGCTFHVDLPFKTSEIRPPLISLQKNLPLNRPRTDQTDQKGLRLLLADDAEENCDVIVAFLKDAPFQISQVEDGIQAVETFKKAPFDLVLMDIQMPGKDGYDATREIRLWEKEQNRPPAPIIALTANAMKEDIAKAKKVGCNLHLSKPVRKDTLLKAISQVMDAQ